MNRLLEVIPTPEDAVVSRVLVVVHKAVDEHFPEAKGAGRQFTKTVFSDESSEHTKIVQTHPPPTDPPKPMFASSEATLPDGRAAETLEAKPPQTPLDNEIEDESDWVSRILIALLISGLLLLGYILFF